MFRTITAKYDGTCKRCHGPISPGDKIRYGGRGRTYHLAADCPNGTAYTDDPPTSHLGNAADPNLTDPADNPPPSYHYSVTDDDRQAFTFTTIQGVTVKSTPDLDF